MLARPASSPQSAQSPSPAGGLGSQAKVQGIVDQAAQAAQQQGHQASSIQSRVNQSLDAFQRDGNPAHLLDAISSLQSMVQVSSQLARATGACASDLARAASLGPGEGLLGKGPKPLPAPAKSPAELVKSAEQLREQVKRAANSIRDAAEEAVRSLKEAARSIETGKSRGRSEGLPNSPVARR